MIPKSSPDQANAIGTSEQAGILIDPGTSKVVSDTLQADSPQLWTLDDPNLYLLRTEVIRDGQVADTYDTEFGFRYTKIDPNTGFSLNGISMKLKGVSMHHDQGSLGAASYYRSLERQVEILKEMGCNAIRTTHNPADKKLLEICNENGMLVVEEAFDTWMYPKNGNSYDFSKWFNVPIEAGNAIEGGKPGMPWAEFDLKSYIKRDDNDPSLIMYSLGNEVMEGLAGGVDYSRFPKTARKLIDWAEETDGTRPVTTGDDLLKGGSATAQEIGKELTAAGGMVGFNYAPGSGPNSLDDYHSRYPDWKLYGAETASAINSRGIYSFRGNINSPTGYQRTAYDESRVGWGHVASDAWYTVLTRDFMAGEFVWTGFDYIGEPTPWNGTGSGPAAPWPAPKSSYFGIVDTAGFPKDSYYFYQSQWNDHVHTLHILPAWNSNVAAKDADNKVKVVVYTDAPSAELFFTPKDSDTPQSLGRKTFTQKKTPEGYGYQIYEGEGKSTVDHENLYLNWMVPYEDGTITAKAYTDGTGNTEMTDTEGRGTVTTTGAPWELSVSTDRDSIVADGKDLAYITVNVTDQKGNIVPDADSRIHFTVQGGGELVGVDNGDASDHDSYQADNRKAFSGKVLAIVRSTRNAGAFTLTASGPGLAGSSVTVTTTPAPENPGAEGEITGYTLSKYYYVKTGTMPELPRTVTVRSAGGTDGIQTVTWSPIRDEEIQKPGSFVVTGILEGGSPITVTISMIDNIGALLNYSCAVQTGSRPALPASRPAVMADGKILNVQFPVAWDNVDPSSFDSAGMVQVNGTSQVFGNVIAVKAHIRVSDEVITVGSNVAPKAMTLEENTPLDQQSDTLQAVIDNSTAYRQAASGEKNTSCWTNRQFSRTGGTKSDIVLTYATAQRLSQAVIYLLQDSEEARIPEQTELFYSKGGTAENDWIEIPATAQAGTERDLVTPYTYHFNSPVDAVLFKISITNSTEDLGGGRKPYTGITEIQLNRAIGSFIQYSDAALSGLILNGSPVPEIFLEKGSYSTQALLVDTLDARGKNNASVTLLPPSQDFAMIVTESEDHSRRSVFQIQLGQEQEQDPNDGSGDYDITKTTATAPSSEEAHGLTPAQAVDGDVSTLWHTKWGQVTPAEDRYIMLELDDAAELDAVRYLPKTGSQADGSNNGRIHEYRVDISQNGTDWKTASTGSWPDESGWKLAIFDRPATAKYVRLYGVHTYGVEAEDKYENAAEVHLRKAMPTVNLENQAQVILDSYEVELGQEGVGATPAVYVSMNGVPLRYGLDYVASYENNTRPGKAAVRVKGILKYSGVISVNFTILEKNSQEISVAGGRITAIDSLDYEGGSAAKLARGHIVTVRADAPPEGKTFSHWRIIPSETTISDAEQPEAAFMVPGNACRLIAIYKSEDGSAGSAAILSKAIPGNWFAYANEDDLEIVLAKVLTEQDRQDVFEGNQVQAVMNIEKTDAKPDMLTVPPAQIRATSSNALPAGGTPSNALARLRPNQNSGSAHVQAPSAIASASDADYAIASASDADYAIASASDADYAAALPRDAAWSRPDAIDEAYDTDTVGFYIRTKLSKTTKKPGGSATVRAQAPGRVKITFQLPEKDQGMADYIIIPYSENEDSRPAASITPEPDGGLMSFDAAVNGVYELRYNLCHTVTFVDYDGRIISARRVKNGEAAVEPDAPYREGYAFLSWNKEFGSVTRDMTIKAKYEKTDSGPTKDLLNEKLQEIREKMGGVRRQDYTGASWNRLVYAMDGAIKIASDENASQNEVARAIQELSLGWNGLKLWIPSYYQDDSDRMVPAKQKKHTDPIPVISGTWASGLKGWKYRLSDGSYAASQWDYIQYQGVKEWYRFDAKGDMVIKWYKDADGSLYYMDPNPGSSIGRLFTGWHWITGDDGKDRCYYFQEASNGTRGKLLSRTKTPDGYDLDDRGQWIVNGVVQTKE